MKRSSLVKSRGMALAILCGGLMFSGPAASADVVFSENFEGGTNLFGMPTYGYSGGYTLANSLTPGGGAQYGMGGFGISGAVSSNTFPASPITGSLLAGGLTGELIDAGQGTFDLYAQFSTYKNNNDFSQLTLTFKDGSNAAVGSPITLGSEAFVAALAGGSGNRAWGEDSVNGFIPAGARTFALFLTATKSASGSAIDSYVDNISLDIAAVPEPAAGALLMLSAGGLLSLRRRR